MFSYANIRKSILLSALVAAASVIGPTAMAQPTLAEPSALAVSITKQQAVSIALQAVGGGTVLQTLLERENGFVHWSVDIVGSRYEYEVWVSTRGKVLKIITQPL